MAPVAAWYVGNVLRGAPPPPDAERGVVFEDYDFGEDFRTVDQDNTAWLRPRAWATAR